MITAIETATSLLDYNRILRDLCDQHRKKSLPSQEFIRAFCRLTECASKLGLRLYYDHGTFAPVDTDPQFMAEIQSKTAGLAERDELQYEADLLRTKTRFVGGYQWQLSWYFLLERASELGFFWKSEIKKFV